jgi:xylulokinase
LQHIDPANVQGISLSIQRETFVPVDVRGQALRPAILWMDTRASEQVAVLTDELPDFLAQTGKRLSVNLLPPKWRWLQEHEPEVVACTAQVWDVHAYLMQQLTGAPVTSWGCVGPTGILDLNTMEYARPVLDAIGLTKAQLPALAAPGEMIGFVTTQAAAETGLHPTTPVYAGIGDGQACGIGAGINVSGKSYLTLGTSVISGTYAPNFLTDNAFRTMVGGAGSYLLETVLLSGTYTIDWYLKTLLNGITSLDELTLQAAQLPAGAEGLVLLPYWNSVLNPYWDADARGVILGWRGIHTQAHVLRAILEGIAFEQRLHTEGVEKALDSPIDTYIVMGGGSQSDLWCQIIADVTGRTVQRSATTEAASLGVAMLSAVEAGFYPDLVTASDTMSRTVGEPFLPDVERSAVYERLYNDVYLPLYPALKGIMGKL